ncbi:MAG TPA: PaaI family thioesterase [Acidimicrobiales bacterium]
MTNDERRIAAASKMRQLGHAFVGTALTDEQLDAVTTRLDELITDVVQGERRERTFSRDRMVEFMLTLPTEEQSGTQQMFGDSIVAGWANPMGLAARLWREGDVAVMKVTLGNGFEGAPGRAHGGVVAALLDEVMGFMNAIHGTMAFTAQLDITYHAPTPVGEPIIARAWLERSDGRKRYVVGELHADDVLIASAKGLFIAPDHALFIEQFATPES